MAEHGPLQIFYSYAHRDERLRDVLEMHLSMLKRQGLISEWHDRQITPGSEWDGVIDSYLNTADIILLLVSADFLASRYCYDTEVTRAMERHATREALVIPVILRPCDWKDAPFSKLQALPKDARPVTTWPNRDEAFHNVVEGLKMAVAAVVESRSKS